VTRLRIHCIGVSADGFAAGPDQSLQNPMGVGGMALHEWVFTTRMFHRMVGKEGGSTGVDNQFADRGFEGIGAWILGRNMFTPSRGAWPDDGWRGWWGDEPPYHCPVFVLTHHPRASIEMQGGTTFHFVTDGLHAALERARTTASGRDVRLGGGASTIRQALEARLVDEMHLAIAPAVLGRGEPLFAGLDLPALGYERTEHVLTDAAMHLVFQKRAG
jgi:dihydrofolate reductase